jgi:HNH endonuclease.
MRGSKRIPRNTNQRDRDRARIRATKANCHICGEPIDYTLRTPDPMSFEVDHVIPLAKGGADNITNKAAAHRACNSKKRARLIAPIVRRSGSLT